MLEEKDIRELSEVYDTKPTFLSIYLNLHDKNYKKFMEKREKEVSKILKKDRELHNVFEKNIESIKEHMKTMFLNKKGLAIFCNSEKDFLKAFQFPKSLGNLFVVDSSPYIRQIVCFLEEYENFCLILIDHSNARMFLISAAEIADKKEIHKDIFHHHKKGGFSQMRYQRIREGNILHFFKEAVEDISKMIKDEDVRRIIIAGPQVPKKQFMEHLTKDMQEKVIGFIETDIDTPQSELLKEAFGIFFEKEREEETEMVENLKNEILRDGLAVFGVKETMNALHTGKAEKILLNMGIKIRGWKCERCKVVEKGDVENCKYCNQKVYSVDVIEEIVEDAEKMGTEMEFIEPNETLEEIGGIGAFLRYK